MSSKKLSRTDYHVAWIAPVADLEVLPSRLMLDEEHDVPDYDTAYDDNVYIFGAVAGHNVVIASCPPGLTGNVNAGRLTGPLFKTFSGIRMALLVGIGGGIPRAHPSDDPTENIHLGDVVVGWPGDGQPACLYYDHGRLHTDGKFETLGTIGQPDWVLLNALGKLVSDHDVDRTTFQVHRKRLLTAKHKRKFTFPGLDKDQLFQAAYRHHGQYGDKCASCDPTKLVARPERTDDDVAGFIFHRGRIATGNAVIQDGERRNQIRDQCNGALCVEMEAAGVDASRSCLVVRGISDYADAHKGDVWRSYAAGNAAVFARELLSKIPPSQILNSAIKVHELKSHFMVPFGRNERFVGRETTLKKVLERIPPSVNGDTCQRTIIEGLGGIGKTQVAIEAAHRVHKAHPDCSIFWVPAVNIATFEKAYREIGQRLGLQDIEDDKADVKQLVKQALNGNDVGNWLLIIDNADDMELLFNKSKLMSYLPFNLKGSILITTRNHQAAVRFDSRGGIIVLDELGGSEASQLLHQDLTNGQVSDAQSTAELLEYLAHLPLAIRQASAYMASNTNVTVSKYLRYCRSSDKSLVELLSKDFDDQDRYEAIHNPVATTWLISFEHVSRDSPLAAEYLSFICYLAEKDIPKALLPTGEDEIEADEAIGILKAYAFILERETSDRFDIHRLVRLVMRNWLKKQAKEQNQVTETIRVLGKNFPWPEHENRDAWMAYLPHVQAALEAQHLCVDDEALCFLLYNIAQSKVLLGNYAESAQMSRQALALSISTRGPEHPGTLSSMNNLATVLEGQGKLNEAEQLHRQVLQLRERILGSEHPDTLQSMNNLATILKGQGKLNEAEQLHRQALQLRERIQGSEHPDTLQSMNNLANVLKGQGKLNEAEQLHRQALQLRERVLGPEYPNTLTSMNNLATVLEGQGKLNEAEQLHRQALQLRERILGPEHPNTLSSMNNLAVTLGKQGKLDEAEAISRESLELGRKVFGNGHAKTLRTMNFLADVLQHQGLFEDADRLHLQTMGFRRARSKLEEPHILWMVETEIKAIYTIADYFAEHKPFLQQNSLQRMSKDILIIHYRRILNAYHTSLRCEAIYENEMMVVELFRCRTKRAILARKIVELAQENEMTQQRHTRSHRQELNDWLARMPSSRRSVEDNNMSEPEKSAHMDTTAEKGDHDRCEDDNEDNNLLESGSSARKDEWGNYSGRPQEDVEFPEIARLESFLQRGQAFQILLHKVRLLQIPVLRPHTRYQLSESFSEAYYQVDPAETPPSQDHYRTCIACLSRSHLAALISRYPQRPQVTFPRAFKVGFSKHPNKKQRVDRRWPLYICAHR